MAVDQAGERLLVAGLQARQQLVLTGTGRRGVLPPAVRSCSDREPPSNENENENENEK
jgi:hypothetical protein